MTREEYSKQINWNGTATREIRVNPGLCWTDGGEFQVESYGKFSVIFVITENIDGHLVDYDNEVECEDLGAEDCSREKEILIDREFTVVEFQKYDKETGFAKVLLK
jgi:hypothetical protein